MDSGRPIRGFPRKQYVDLGHWEYLIHSYMEGKSLYKTEHFAVKNCRLIFSILKLEIQKF